MKKVCSINEKKEQKEPWTHYENHEGEEKRMESLFKEVMEKHLNTEKEMDIQIHEAEKIPNKLNL